MTCEFIINFGFAACCGYVGGYILSNQRRPEFFFRLKHPARVLYFIVVPLFIIVYTIQCETSRVFQFLGMLISHGKTRWPTQYLHNNIYMIYTVIKCVNNFLVTPYSICVPLWKISIKYSNLRILINKNIPTIVIYWREY